MGFLPAENAIVVHGMTSIVNCISVALGVAGVEG